MNNFDLADGHFKIKDDPIYKTTLMSILPRLLREGPRAVLGDPQYPALYITKS